VIIGVRLGIVNHINDNVNVFNFDLDDTDRDSIDDICNNSNNLFENIGDCGDEYR
jgi:diketogulonate reductase-like aldo/keto reductase